MSFPIPSSTIDSRKFRCNSILFASLVFDLIKSSTSDLIAGSYAFIESLNESII